MIGQGKPVNIFLAVDGSEHARAAVETICSLPLSNLSKVTALAVLDTPHTLRRQLLMDELNQVQACFNKLGINSEIGLLHGHPAEAITAFADEHHPDLIVLGAKGLRATLGILLGGVAQQVIEYTHWPVLIVRPPSRFIHRVLAAVDGSVYSNQVLEYLTAFPFSSEMEVHLVYVVPPYPEQQTGSFSQIMLGSTDSLHPLPVELLQEVENWQSQAEEKGEQILVHSRDLISASGYKISTTLVHGDAATEILKYSQEHKVDLIAAGSRGLSQVKGWLLGSVSRKLVHYAPCSVLIMRR